MFLLPNNFLGRYNLTARIMLFLIFMDLWARKGKSVFKVNYVKIRQGPLDIITSISLLALFLWISFFAPLVGGRFRSEFLLGLIILLAIFAFLGKEFGSLIFNKEEIPIWIFLLAMTGGLVNGTNPDVSYHHFRSFIFIGPFIYFFAKTAFHERYAIVILRGLCFMALVVCIFGIIEFFTRQNFIYRELISNFCYESFKGRRMMSTHIHPAPLGTYLVAIFPLSIVLILKEEKIFLKSLAIISALIIFISIVLTFSRGAVLGAFAGILILLIYCMEFQKVTLSSCVGWINPADAAGQGVIYLFRHKIICLISALILLVALIITISSLLAHNKYFYFNRFGLQGLSMLSIYINKLDRFLSTWKILKDHPFFGLGFGQYRFLFDHYLPHMADKASPLSKVPDCMYIALLAETGLVGFGGFVLFVSCLIKRVLRKPKILDYKNKLLMSGFLAGFAGMLAAFLTYDTLYWTAPSYLFWAYAGILAKLSSEKLE